MFRKRLSDNSPSGRSFLQKPSGADAHRHHCHRQLKAIIRVRYPPFPAQIPMITESFKKLLCRSPAAIAQFPNPLSLSTWHWERPCKASRPMWYLHYSAPGSQHVMIGLCFLKLNGPYESTVVDKKEQEKRIQKTTRRKSLNETKRPLLHDSHPNLAVCKERSSSGTSSRKKENHLKHNP